MLSDSCLSQGGGGGSNWASLLHTQAEDVVHTLSPFTPRRSWLLLSVSEALKHLPTAPVLVWDAGNASGISLHTRPQLFFQETLLPLPQELSQEANSNVL